MTLPTLDDVLARHRAGDSDAALAACEARLAADPADADTRYLRGQLRLMRGDVAGGRADLEQAVPAAPGVPDIIDRWAVLLRARDAAGDTAGVVDAYARIGDLALLAADLGRAERAFSAALALAPERIELNALLAQLAQSTGRPAEAQARHAQVLAADPLRLSSRLGMALAELWPIYPDRDTMLGQRQRFLDALDALSASLDSQPFTLSGEMTLANNLPFELAYQGMADVEPMRRYGAIIDRAVRAVWPGAMQPAPVPLAPGEPIRVGFITGYLRDHSVTKLFGGWMEHLDRRRFQVTGIAVEGPADATTRRLAAAVDRCLEGPRPVADWIAAIRGLGLHALVWLDVGMAPITSLLAAARLAPVQAMAWGHPVTSGLPQMDYFLTSALMEPPEGDDHYTERLVRLPGLSVHYTPPAPAPRLARRDFGLPDDRILFLSCQLLLKHLPQHDHVFVDIARRVPEARIVMLGHPRSDVITSAFRDRLARAFTAAGLAIDDHVILLPPQPADRYLALLRVTDIFLDGVGWSGGVTTLEAIMAGLPLAAIPGPVMRSRHTAAILTAMDLPELIALSVSGFVELMARMGTESGYRAEVAAKIAARRHRLIGDLAPVRALEQFLAEAVRLSSARS